MPEIQLTAANEQHKYYPLSGTYHVQRNSFWTAGQDSHTKAPAQQPDLFESLANVEPITRGVLERRRGYTLFSNTNPTVDYTRSYGFRSDNLNLRELVWSSTSQVDVTNESGTLLNSPLFIPSGTQAPRMVLSRDYGYFADGNAVDSLKWDGTQAATALSKWGIDINSSQASIGPNSPTVANSGSSGSAIRPTTFTNDALGTGNPFNSPNLAFDGNLGTFASGIDAQFPAATASCSWQGFPAGPPSSTSVTLSIKSGVIKSGTGIVNCKLQYSLNNGGSFTTIYSTGLSRGVATDVVTLPSNQDLTQVQVLAQASYISGTGDSIEQDVYEIFINASGSAWTLPNNSLVLDGLVAQFTTPAVTSASSPILIDQGFGFGSLTSGNVTGILVEAYINQIAYSGNANARVTVFSQLLKAGTATGVVQSATTLSPGPVARYIPIGGLGNLWGTTWLPSDISNVGFGVNTAFSVVQTTSPGHTTLGTVLVGIDHVRITVFTSAAPLVATPTGTGNITLLNGRVYFYALQNSKTGTTSTISPPSLTTGPVTNQTIVLTGLPSSTDPQVDTLLILATADGGDETTLYIVTSLPIGTATYTDNTPDALTSSVPSGPSLLTANVWQDTDIFGNLHGIANNNPPPIGFFPTKHKGRIYLANGPNLFFSKNLDDVTTSTGTITTKWEEAWPATNALDISQQDETIQGLLSDGETLWIGTERSIRRLVGDSPTNFQVPEVQFNEAGLLSQEVWKIVMYEGQPVGVMWITPDLRIMSSDFNTYQDVGTPVQDVLNSINTNALQTSHACFVSGAAFDLYMLYIPTGTSTTPNTILVYNIRSQRWTVWSPTDTVTTSLFNISANGTPQWLFASSAGPLYFWDSTINLDRNGGTPTTYSTSAQTSWLDLGDPTMRKALNQLLVISSDSGLTISVLGATTDGDLDSGAVLIASGVPVQTGPLGDLFIPLAGYVTKYRWYKFLFTSSNNTTQDVLDGFNLEVIPFHRW